MKELETKYRVNEQGMIVEEIEGSENESISEEEIEIEKLVLRDTGYIAQI